MTPLSVLMLEDRKSDAELLVHHLRHVDFDITPYRTETESEFLAHFHSSFDLILASYSFPQFDALGALHLLQQQNLDIPFIIVTVTISQETAVECMKQGASDFLLKDRLERLGPAVSQALERKKLGDESQRMENALRESEERYRQLVELCPDAILVHDGEKVLYTNSVGAQDLLGLKLPSELIGKNLSDYIHPDARQTTVATFQALQTDGVHPSRAEFTLTLVDGRALDVEASSAPLTYEGHVARIFVIRAIAERKRREAGMQYQMNLLANVHDAIIATDEKLMLTAWNRAAEALYGWKAHEVLGSNLVEVLPQELDESQQAEANRTLTETGYLRVELIQPHKDGYPVHIEGTTIVLRHENGQISGYASVNRDVTERELAEAQVRFQAKLLEQVSDAIISLDLNQRVTYLNRGSERLYGWTSDEVIGESLSSFVTTQAVTDTIENIIRVVMETGSWSGEYVQTLKDGTSFSVLNTTTLLHDTRGNPVGYVGINRDITESKRADEARARLAAIVESSDDAIISKTLDGTIMSWNAGAERIFGYAAAEIIGKSITILIPPDQVAEETKILEMIVRGERIEHYETVRVSKEGQHLQMSMTISPLRDNSGQIIGASKIARDISGLKRAEEVLRHHANQIEALANLSQTLASVSFDTEALAKTITREDRQSDRRCLCSPASFQR